jgi:hypothetical protein
MPNKQALLLKAEECLRLASQPDTVTVTAVLLRMLATDYFEMAQRISQRPRQEVQPDEWEAKGRE